jgi:hypothetical protein
MPSAMAAAAHERALLKRGFTVAQVVHDATRTVLAAPEPSARHNFSTSAKIC